MRNMFKVWLKRSESFLGFIKENASTTIAVASMIIAGISMVVSINALYGQELNNAWRSISSHMPGNSGVGPALEYLHKKGLNLSNVDLRPFYKAHADEPPPSAFIGGIDLIGVNMSNAWFDNTNFSNAKLTKVNFINAKINNANFSNVKLDRSIFVNAKANSANFMNAELIRVDLVNAEANSSNFTNAELTNIRASNLDLMNATITDAIFRRCL